MAVAAALTTLVLLNLVNLVGQAVAVAARVAAVPAVEQEHLGKVILVEQIQDLVHKHLEALGAAAQVRWGAAARLVPEVPGFQLVLAE